MNTSSRQFQMLSTSSRQFQIAKYSLSSKHFNFCGGNITHKERTAEGGYDLLLSVTPRERYPDGDSEFGPLLLHREYILHTTKALLFWARLLPQTDFCGRERFSGCHSKQKSGT